MNSNALAGVNRFSKLIMLFLFAMTGYSHAYIDPGSVGSAYQVGYLVFYSVMGILVFFFRPIKNLFVSMFDLITGRKSKKPEVVEENNKAEND